MVPLMHKVADQSVLYLEEFCGKNLDGKAFLRKFALDVIVSTGFGYEINSFINPNNPFANNCNMLISKQSKYLKMLSKILEMFAPRLFKYLDLPYFDQDVAEFFVKMISQSIEERKKNGIRRNDFIDLVQDILVKEGKKDLIGHKDMEELQEILVSNAFLLYVVGFEMISSSASVLLYYLSKYPEHQERLFQEIYKAVDDFGDERLDYTSIMNMKYLEMCLQESQRLYPISHLERASVKEYRIPTTDITIPKGIYVRFPINAVMKDKKYFPNPNIFNPEHFNKENNAKRHAFAFSPFGHGPRNCIAERFSKMEIKLAVARIIYKFKLLPCEKTVDELIPDPKSRARLPIGGLWFSLERR